jgi:lipid-A-disaccharide synthase
MKLFFSVGEPSGDVHAAALIEKIRELAPQTEFLGFGGPKMAQTGCRLLTDMTQLAVMWVAGVIAKYFTFRRLLAEAKQVLESEQVDAVILVDFPGFNWHIAKAAKNLEIPVIYFMPPQVWAWAQWRVKKMQRLVTLVLCALPFEYRWFRQRNCKAVYMGHPFFEEIRSKKSNPDFLETFYEQYRCGPILTLLAGSRNQEITANLDDMIHAVQHVRNKVPNVQPVFAAFSEIHAETIQHRLAEWNESIPVFVGRTTELIRAADCCLAVSGSVSLELLACNKPTVIYYRVGTIPLFIQRFFRRTRYITLVNLLGADRKRNERTGRTHVFYEDSKWIIPAEPSHEDRSSMLFPEFLTARDRSKDAAAVLVRWLANPILLASAKQRLESLLHEADNVESPLDQAAKTLIEMLYTEHT